MQRVSRVSWVLVVLEAENDDEEEVVRVDEEAVAVADAKKVKGN